MQNQITKKYNIGVSGKLNFGTTQTSSKPDIGEPMVMGNGTPLAPLGVLVMGPSSTMKSDLWGIAKEKAPVRLYAHGGTFDEYASTIEMALKTELSLAILLDDEASVDEVATRQYENLLKKLGAKNIIILYAATKEEAKTEAAKTAQWDMLQILNKTLESSPREEAMLQRVEKALSNTTAKAEALPSETIKPAGSEAAEEPTEYVYSVVVYEGNSTIKKQSKIC